MSTLFNLVIAALVSWQAKTILGLIFLDVALGIASATRRGVFDWKAVAMFYRTNVIPYLIGYTAIYVAIKLMIPPDALQGMGEPLNEGLVILAWGFVISALVGSVLKSVRELYQSSGK